MSLVSPIVIDSDGDDFVPELSGEQKRRRDELARADPRILRVLYGPPKPSRLKLQDMPWPDPDPTPSASVVSRDDIPREAAATESAPVRVDTDCESSTRSGREKGSEHGGSKPKQQRSLRPLFQPMEYPTVNGWHAVGRMYPVVSASDAADPILELSTPKSEDDDRFLTARKFVDTKWPRTVMHLRDQFNPKGIVFESVRTTEPCGCDEICSVWTCRNAKQGVYCTEAYCTFDAFYGNSLIEKDFAVLKRVVGSTQLAVVTTRDMPSGIIIGEYLGELHLEVGKRAERTTSSGFTMQMRAKSVKQPSATVMIEAKKCGSMMRHMNHSCEPTARFVELSYKRHHTVAAVTCKEIKAGEEVTVDYGDDLWFLCECGFNSCRHRHLWP